MIDYGPAIDARCLTRPYGNRLAGDNVTLRVERGELLAFIGPNGSGKGTTVRMLCGILKPSGGVARVLGFDVATEPEKVKQHLGYMRQRFSLYMDLTVRANLEFYAGVYGVPKAVRRARLDELVAMAGLQGRERQRVSDLSGGRKQRLALSCSIVHDPPLLFFDEPTAGVDPVSRRRFFAMIFSLVRQGGTIFLTTHYLDEAEYAKRVGIIQPGTLRALASPREIRAHALEGRLFSVSCDAPIAAVDHLREAPGVLEAALYGTTIHALVDPARQSAEGLIGWLMGRAIEVFSLTPIAPSLEDVFISLSSGFQLGADGRHVDLEAKCLRRILLFASLDERLLTVIANRFVTEHHPSGERLFEQGDLGDRVYVIVRGAAEVLRAGTDGRERLVAVLGEGDFFGEIVLLRQVRRTAALRVRDSCFVLTLARAELLDLLDAAPDVRARLETIATSRLSALDAQF